MKDGMSKWVLLGAGIAVEVVASMSLKAALDHPAWFISVVLGYALSFFLFWMALKRGLPLGVGYGIWGAVGIALTALLAAVIFAEPLTPLMIAGMGIAIGGVVLVHLGARSGIRKKTGELQ
jgi:small multidrug resistance pump